MTELTYYFAPLEGITNYIYRTTHAAFFSGVDAYFSPFLSPRSKKSLTGKERSDVHPANNAGTTLVPQVLTNDAAGFLLCAEALAELGYPTVNLNLGCPSGTVVPKGKGAGFLAYQPELDRFLEEVCAKSPIPVSVKTRIGLDYEEEWEELLPIFNRYPLHELIIHPRLRSDYYKNHPHMDVFRDAVAASCNPVVYNGDLFTVEDVLRFAADFPTVRKVMLGRGLLTNPALVRQCRGGAPADKATLRRFYDTLVERYREIMPGDRAMLFKMKEFWFYQGQLFADSEKQLKQIRKAQRWSDYQAAVDSLFARCDLEEGGRYHG